MAARYPEQHDLARVASWLKNLDIEARPFERGEQIKTKTPDFKLLSQRSLIGFCEVKSPDDPWLDNLLANSAGEIVGGARQDPIFNRLARHINTAHAQFEAVNSDREKINLLAFVNHDPQSDIGDLYTVLTGFERTDRGKIYTAKRIADEIIGNAKFRIDGYAWFEGEDSAPRLVIVSEDAVRGDLIKHYLRAQPSRNLLAG